MKLGEGTTPKLKEGQIVKVLDESYNRWFTAKILWVDRLDENGKPNAWTVELLNGNRGSFDIEHVKEVS